MAITGNDVLNKAGVDNPAERQLLEEMADVLVAEDDFPRVFQKISSTELRYALYGQYLMQMGITDVAEVNFLKIPAATHFSSLLENAPNYLGHLQNFYPDELRWHLYAVYLDRAGIRDKEERELLVETATDLIRDNPSMV